MPWLPFAETADTHHDRLLTAAWTSDDIGLSAWEASGRDELAYVLPGTFTPQLWQH